jgi:hypothetical protein
MSRGGSSFLAGLIADRYLCTTRSGCGEAIVCGSPGGERRWAEGRKVVYASFFWFDMASSTR